MPDYNDWDALFYALWYQPTQINLAYTLARDVLDNNNPLLTGDGTLQVVDFGCGALAMQFGLALAAADGFEEREIQTPVAILSEDKSAPMRDMGLKLWTNFVNEIDDRQKYPELEALRQVCREIRLDDRGKYSRRWLTVLHTAYPKAVCEIRSALDPRVKLERPDLIIVTMNNIVDPQWGYSPPDTSAMPFEYISLKSEVMRATELGLQGKFASTSDFRRNLYSNCVSDILSERDNHLARYYLTEIDTRWVAPKSNTHIGIWYMLEDLPW